MKTKKLIRILSLVGVVLTSCTFRDEKQDVSWSKWHDNGDGTHSRHSLNDITVQETQPHTFTLNKVVAAPTDVAPGKELYKCDLCGALESRDVPPTGNYVFDQKVVSDKYIYERCSEHSAIYYMSSVEGAYGNPNALFEHTDIGEEYTEVEYVKSDGSQFIDTEVINSENYLVSYNNEMQSKAIPEAYQEVEYIQKQGNQYIDTGFVPNYSRGFKVEIEFSTSVDKKNYCLVSNYNSPSNISVEINESNKAKLYLGHTGIEVTVGEINPGFENRNKVILEYANSEMTLTCNGYPKRVSFPLSGNAGESLFLFVDNALRFDQFSDDIRLYSLKIFDGSMLVRNLLPCYEKSTEKVSLYDSVYGEFYFNKGTGEFLKGNKVSNRYARLPSDYQEVEYLESNGLQKIDSGLKINKTDTGIIRGRFHILEDNNNTYAGANYLLQLNAPKSAVCKRIINHEMHFENGATTHYVDGVQFKVDKYTTLPTNVKIGVFALGAADNKWWSPGGTQAYAGLKMRLYSETIELNGFVKREFIPCYRLSDGVAGLYDIVNQDFYSNVGTGEFVKGPFVGSGNASRLPNEYKEVECIVADGTQYIDTGFADTVNTIVAIDVQYTDVTTVQQRIFGHGYDSDTGANVSFEAYINGDNQWARATSDGKGIWQASGKAADTNRHTFVLDNERFVIYNNGRTIGYDEENNSHITRENTENLTLLARSDGSRASRAKLFGCKIWDGEVLKRDFVPCYKKADGEVGLFDLVTCAFFTNAGTGEFTKGREMGSSIDHKDYSSVAKHDLPETYHQVAYIQSFGDVSINTGVVGKARLELIGSFACVNKNQLMGYAEEAPLCFGVGTNNKYVGADLAISDKDTIIYDCGYSTEDKAILNINDTEYVRTDLPAAIDDQELKLFSLGGAGGSYFKFYEAKIYQNNVLVRDFIPVRNIYFNKYGIYDLVQDKAYEAADGIRTEGGSDFVLPTNEDHINLFISRSSNESITRQEQITNCKIYNLDNSIYREFVPVIRNSDGKPGFFEVKEQKFYTNEYGNELKFGNKVGHHFDKGVTQKEPTHTEDGLIVYTCSICGRKVYEKADRLAYKVTFVVPDYVATIRIFQEIDPSKYEEGLVGYTRNINTYNYSKISAMIRFEVMTTEEVELVVTSTNGEVQELDGTNLYRVINIVHDCVITIVKK